MKKAEEKEKKVTKVTKSKAKKKEVKGPKEGYFKKVKKELKLVKWPSFKEVIKYTISTIVFCLILCAVFMLLNYILSEIVSL